MPKSAARRHYLLVLALVLLLFVYYSLQSRHENVTRSNRDGDFLLRRTRSEPAAVSVFAEDSTDSVAQCLYDSERFKNAVRQQEKMIKSYAASTDEEYLRLAWMSLSIENHYVWRDVKLHSRLWKHKSDVEEYKYFIEFSQSDASCNVISLGIGQAVDVERALSQRFPQCRFLGVDPNPTVNKGLFEGIKPGSARYIHAAISEKRGSHAGSYQNDIGHYENRALEYLGVKEFFREHVGNEKLIDLLMIDVEGEEYGIIRQLLDDPTAFPTICQINIEFHYPLKEYNMHIADFFGLLKTLLQRYALMNVDISANVDGYLRTFFVNRHDKQCRQKYLC